MSADESADQRKEDAPGGITEIAVQGFKSLHDEQRIAVRPLTILAGANNSGKSSIMQPLLMMKQTLDATYDAGPLKLDGPNVEFTSAEQFLSRRLSDTGIPMDLDEAKFTVGLEVQGDEWMASTFQYRQGRGIDIFEIHTPNWPISKLRPEMKIPGEEINEDVRARIPYFTRLSLGGNEAITKIEIYRARCFLGLELYSGSRSTRDSSPYLAFEQCVGSLVIHVPALRENSRAYPKVISDFRHRLRFPGTFENYIASIIEFWQDTQDDRLGKLGQALASLGLTWKVEARRLNDVEIELRAARLPKRQEGEQEDLVNIADMGVGVSQVLPALVALLTAIPGQLVYLEHPERDLHPRAQVKLARLLSDAARRGVRVVVETHSSLLLLGVQTLVAEGTLPPDLVALHWFERGEDGATQVKSRELDEFGAYGDWPQDFADVSLDTHSEYLKAVSKRRWGK